MIVKYFSFLFLDSIGKTFHLFIAAIYFQAQQQSLKCLNVVCWRGESEKKKENSEVLLNNLKQEKNYEAENRSKKKKKLL